MVDLNYIAKTYAILMSNARGQFIEAELAATPRSAKKTLEFLSGYTSQRYYRHKVDFYSDEGASPEAIRTRPDDRDVFSIVRMDRRVEGTKRRDVHIWINTGVTTHAEPVLNHCWARFCLVKEGCQAVLFEAFCEDNNMEADYPVVRDFNGIRTLVAKIEDEPFSLHDFGSGHYSSESEFENAAEILAVGLMMGFEDLYALQKRITEELDGDVSRLGTLQIAVDHLVPLRYLELMLRWTNLGALVALIEDHG